MSKKGGDRGQTTLNRGPYKPKKILEKIPQKVQFAVSDLFSAEVVGFGLFYAPWRFRSQVLAQKCDLHFQHSWE